MNTPLPPAAAAQATATAPGIGFGTLALLLGWPLVVVGIAAHWLDQRSHAAIEAAIEARPSIAIIDEAAFVRDQPRTGNDDRDVLAGIRRAEEAAEKLSAAGFVVLNRAAVYRGPAEIQVRSTAPAADD